MFGVGDFSDSSAEGDSSEEQHGFLSKALRKGSEKRWLGHEAQPGLGHVRKKRRVAPVLTSNISFNFVKGGVVTADDMKLPQKQATAASMDTDSSKPVSGRRKDGRKDVSEMSATEILEELRRKDRNGSDAKAAFGLPSNFGSFVAFGQPLPTASLHSAASSEKPQTTSSQTAADSSSIGGSDASRKDKSKTTEFVPVSFDPQFAKWSGSSFALSMLKKQGFKGRLGRREQGIAKPVQAAGRRQGFTGLGARRGGEHTGERLADGHTELQRLRRALVEKRAKADESRDKREATYKILSGAAMEGSNSDSDSQPRLRGEGSRRHVVAYQSASDLMKAASLKTEISIHDFTSAKGPRVVGSRSDVLSAATQSDEIGTGKRKVFRPVCDELLVNAQTVVSMCASEMERKQRELNHARHTVHSLHLDLERATLKQSALKREHSRMHSVRELVASLVVTEDFDFDLKGNASIDELRHVFEKLCAFHREYLSLELWTLIPSVVFPSMKRALRCWNPLESSYSISAKKSMRKTEAKALTQMYTDCHKVSSSNGFVVSDDSFAIFDMDSDIEMMDDISKHSTLRKPVSAKSFSNTEALKLLAEWHSVLSTGHSQDLVAVCVECVYMPPIKEALRNDWDAWHSPMDGVLLVADLCKSEAFPKNAISHIVSQFVFARLKVLLSDTKSTSFDAIRGCIAALSPWFSTGTLATYYRTGAKELSLGFAKKIKDAFRQSLRGKSRHRGEDTLVSLRNDWRASERPNVMKSLNRVKNCCEVAVLWKKSGLFLEKSKDCEKHSEIASNAAIQFEGVVTDYLLPEMTRVLAECISFDFALCGNEDATTGDWTISHSTTKVFCELATALFCSRWHWFEFCAKGLMQPWLVALHSFLCSTLSNSRLLSDPRSATMLFAGVFKEGCQRWFAHVRHCLRSALSKSKKLDTVFCVYYATGLDLVSECALSVRKYAEDKAASKSTTSDSLSDIHLSGDGCFDLDPDADDCVQLDTAKSTTLPKCILPAIDVLLEVVQSDIPYAARPKSKAASSMSDSSMAASWKRAKDKESAARKRETDYDFGEDSSAQLSSNLAKYAQMHNVVFKPKFGARVDGQQLYTLGAFDVYIQGGLVFARNPKTAEPFGVKDLSELIAY